MTWAENHGGSASRYRGIRNCQRSDAERAEDLPYRKLALHVVALAVKDAAGARVSQVSSLGRSKPGHVRQTATRFLSDVKNPRLRLWCAWLDIDPSYVCERAVRGGTSVDLYRLWKGVA